MTCCWRLALLVMTGSPFMLTAQSSVTLGSASATPGSTVNLPLTLVTRGPQIASIQFTVTHAPGVVSVVQVSSGSEAIRTSKELSCAVRGAGTHVCIVAGSNTTALGDGVIANVSVTLSSAAVNGQAVIGVENGLAATPAGAGAALSTTGSVLTISTSTPVLNTLSCSPQVLAVGETARCSVTLDRPAPANGLTVDLGRGAGSAGNVIMPTSVKLPANQVSAGFNVQVVSVSSPLALIIVASLNGRSRSATVSLTTANAAVVVSILPKAAYLVSSGTKQFTASVTGTANKGVIWSITPANAGTISTTGLYTAPSQVNSTQLVTVRANSAANATKTAVAVAIVYPNRAAPVISSVSVTPGVTDARVVWANSIVATNAVLFGVVPDSAARVASNPTPETSPSIHLTGLVANTTYYYRIRVTDAFGATVIWPAASVPPASFKTLRASPPPAPATLWPATIPPAIPDDGDSQSVELGLKFYSDVPGRVSGIRFYKGSSDNAGSHTGSLWDLNGHRLATVTFRNETETGWQTASFPQPVRIKPGTIYVVSYYSPAGHYSVTQDALSSPVHRAPLHAPADAGVYIYGSGGFPTLVYRSSNYWVDVLLELD